MKPHALKWCILVFFLLCTEATNNNYLKLLGSALFIWFFLSDIFKARKAFEVSLTVCRQLFRQFAERRGLAPPAEDMAPPILLSGDQEGFSFDLKMWISRGLSYDVFGLKVYTECSVTLSRQLPKGLFICPTDFGLVPRLIKLLFGHINIGSAEFDRKFLIRGANPDEVIRYLREPGVSEAVQRAVSNNCYIVDNKVINTRNLISTEEQLEQLLAQTLKMASVLSRR
jgi:hypothetical protein